MITFHEDGMVCEVEVQADRGDSEWDRYELRVIRLIQPSPIHAAEHQPKPGEVLSVDQKRNAGAWGGMWFLRGMRKNDAARVFNEVAHNRLVQACIKWRDKNKPRCAESLMQVDEINLACPDLAEAVCDIIGYWKGPDEEE